MRLAINSKLVRALFITASAATLFSSGDVRADPSPKANFAPMSHEEVDRFRDSLKNGLQLTLVPPHSSENVGLAPAGLFSGIKTEVFSSVGEIVLKFRPNMDELLSRSTTTDDQSKALLNSFELALSIEKTKLKIVHSHTESAAEAAGFLAELVPKRPVTLKTMVKGQRESSFYIAIPPPKDLEVGWGVYVCPRNLHYQQIGRTGTRALHLQQSPYYLSEINFPVQGGAKTSYESSRGNVRAKVEIQPSSEMPETLPVKDEMVGNIADPKLSYRPTRPFDFFRFAPNADIAQGLNILLEHQNRAGYLRRMNYSHVVSVHKSNEPSPISVSVGDLRPASDAGDCYILQVQKYQWSSYSKPEASF